MQIFRQRSVQRRIGRLLAHPVTLLALATILATVAGAWLTNYYQEQSWMREKRFEVYRYRFDEGLKLLDELSDVMGQRLFGLNRVVWVAKGTGTGTLDQVWQEYYESVVEWNATLARNKSRLARLVSTEAAEAFAGAQDAALADAEAIPPSIHRSFLVTHQKVRTVVDCVRDRCREPAKQQALQDAQEALTALGEAIDAFLANCTNQLYASS